MAHFNFENDMNNAIFMESTISKGPIARWQRKALEDSITNTTLNISTNSKTPNLLKSVSASGKTPSKTPKTPGKTSGKKSTPGRKTPKTPVNGGDRFIPNRNATQFDLGYYLVTNENANKDSDLISPSKQEYQRIMTENLNGDIQSAQILAYKNKAPLAPLEYQNCLKVLYSQNKSPNSSKKPMRQIPQVPERILDAPDILDDYYLNLLDWSCNNHLAVALDNSVYIWNASTGEIQQLLQMENAEDFVASVSWITEGNFLAVGTNTGEIQIWDLSAMKKIRSMTGHAGRVSCLSWNTYILSSGSRSGVIHHHDVRKAEHHVATLAGHSQEVCGLKWSTDGKYLASGANDNLLNIWPNVFGSTQAAGTAISPIYTFSQHQAAVKALAWCPFQPHLLASGGGTADRHIRFWNVSTGSLLSSVDTKSQVCAILWSKEYKELVSSHGFANNQLIIWKYPSMVKLAELTGHTSRVLHLAMSPDGSTVVSAAADQTLRLWKCFAIDPSKKLTKSSKKPSSNLLLRQNIR